MREGLISVSPGEWESKTQGGLGAGVCLCVLCVLVCVSVCVGVCWCVLEKERVAGRSPCRTEAGNEREAV